MLDEINSRLQACGLPACAVAVERPSGCKRDLRRVVVLLRPHECQSVMDAVRTAREAAQIIGELAMGAEDLTIRVII
ncbi:MAG: hypothetical protein NUW23_13350 [Firmicutes bacterium]|nr:hypothetical protein [Bacillota bacterium]